MVRNLKQIDDKNTTKATMDNKTLHITTRDAKFLMCLNACVKKFFLFFCLMEAFEGNRDIFRTMGEKAKKLSKVVFKEAKKAVGLHVGTVTEANPIYFIVVANQGAMVRKAIELDSDPVHGLRRGDLVTCVDLSGRRAKIIDPVEGWVSTRTQDNELILEPTIAPDKEIQVSQMEKRFEKLKAEQQQLQRTEDQDRAVPVAGQAASLADVPVKESDFVAVNAIKSKLSFKVSEETPTGFIPKLSGPGLKRLPMPNQATQDLFSLDSPKNVSNNINAPAPFADPPLVQPAPVPNTYVDPFADLFSSAIPQSQPNFQKPSPVHAQPVAQMPGGVPDWLN